jgi:hypothetical protein
MSGSFLLAPLWLRLLALLLFAAVIAGWPGTASGGSAALPSGLSASNPLLVSVKGRCISTKRNRAGRDVLVNRCNQCRIIKIQRKTRGSSFPQSRSYRVGARKEVQLSFKGRGQTRLLSEQPCESEQEAALDHAYKDCAKIAKRNDGTPALINACPICRGVVVQRIAANGSSQRQVYTMTGESIIRIPLRGAAVLRVVSELSCTK